FMLVTVLLSSIFALSACNNKAPVQKGIVFDETSERIHSTGFGNAFKEIIYSIMKEIDENFDRNNPSDMVKGYLAVATKADELLKNSGITEEQYVKLTNNVSVNCNQYVEVLLAYFLNRPIDEKSVDEETTKENAMSFILTFCSVLGKDKFAKFAYDLFEFRLEWWVDYYTEKSKNPEIDPDIHTAKQELATFRSIKLEEFEKLLCGTLLIVDMFSVKVETENFSLSDSETAKLLKIPDFDVNLDYTQWTFLLNKLGDLMPGYYGELYIAAYAAEDGGIRTIALKMDAMMRLISRFQEMMDADAVNMARNDQMNELAVKLVHQMTESDWDLFEGLINFKIDTTSFHGQTVDVYVARANQVTGTASKPSERLADGSVPYEIYEQTVITYEKYIKVMQSGTAKEKAELQACIDNHTMLLTYHYSIQEELDPKIPDEMKYQVKNALLNATPENIEYVLEGILGGITPAFTYGLHNKLTGI
ncbi:MAG: hypothetical protein MJ193_02790, partial [Clostridia bacterium]|nr:hypothetical protein [Clostridia bacterium]